MAALVDDVTRSLNQLSASTVAVADYLAVTAELLRIREAAGEISAADRQRALQAAVAQVRSPTGGASLAAARRDRYAAALRLITLAESRIGNARWPAGLSPAAFRERARKSLQDARIRLAYLSGLDGSLVDAVTPAAEVLGWTQGRVGGGSVFDPLDADIEAATRGVFANLPRPAGGGAPLAGGSPPAAAMPPPVAPVPSSGTGAIAAAEAGTDGQTLQGNTTRTFGGAGTTSAQCRAACDSDGSCGGWVLVKPGFPSPGCYLMSSVTSRIANPCCRSDVNAGRSGGSVAAAAPASSQSAPYDGVSLVGQTLRYYARGTYSECDVDCQKDPNCRGWTWVKPGGYQAGDAAMCYLVARIDSQSLHSCCVSAVKTAAGGAVGTPAAQPTPPAPRSMAFVGCFKDTADFDLNGYLERSAQNTPQRCVSVCQARGFAFAGVQYGESCLCGNRYGKYGAAANCNYPCTGDRGQVCGGYAANSVYSTGAGANAGAAAPPPTPPPGSNQPAANGTWTAWINRDLPDGSADWEALADMRGQVPCATPIAIECRVTSDKRDWRQAGQRYQCSLTGPNPGGICVNADNPPNGCLDYEVRYLCPAR